MRVQNKVFRRLLPQVCGWTGVAALVNMRTHHLGFQGYQ
jgi:hypothetical protein